MTNWTVRVKSRMKELDITQEALARKMGITRGAITHYLAGRRVPPLKQFQKLAAILKADPAWLQYGTASSTKTTRQAATEQKDPLKHPLPILSWEQAAELVDASKIAKAEIKEFVTHFYTDKPRWYALRIKGDSMTAPTSQNKSYHNGEIIIIDPDKAVAHGNDIVAMLPRSKEAVFRQYVVDGGVRYLKPLNPQYSMLQINDDTHICGIVVACIKS